MTPLACHYVGQAQGSLAKGKRRKEEVAATPRRDAGSVGPGQEYEYYSDDEPAAAAPAPAKEPYEYYEDGPPAAAAKHSSAAPRRPREGIVHNLGRMKPPKTHRMCHGKDRPSLKANTLLVNAMRHDCSRRTKNTRLADGFDTAAGF